MDPTHFLAAGALAKERQTSDPQAFYDLHGSDAWARVRRSLRSLPRARGESARDDRPEFAVSCPAE